MTDTKLFCVFFYFIALACAVPRHHRNHTNISKRISYGYDTDIWDAKYYVYFTCANAYCGAALLTTTRVVTAAHCVRHCEAKDVVFFMGMNSRAEVNEGKADRYTATEVHIYPTFLEREDNYYNYDIAVVYVNGEVRTTDRAGPINYALAKPPLNDYIICVGYGATETGQGSDRLKRSWFLTKKYDGNMIVANAEQTSVLSGDSGGPCIYNNQYIGDICGVIFVDGKTYENLEVLTAAPEILSFLRSHGL